MSDDKTSKTFTITQRNGETHKQPKTVIRIAAGATPFGAYRKMGYTIPQALVLTRRYMDRKAKRQRAEAVAK